MKRPWYLKIKWIERILWWFDAVRGLYAHIIIFKMIMKARNEWEASLDPEKSKTHDRGPWTKQVRQHEGMIGHCLLHVLGIYKLHGPQFGEDYDDDPPNPWLEEQTRLLKQQLENVKQEEQHPCADGRIT